MRMTSAAVVLYLMVLSVAGETGETAVAQEAASAGEVCRRIRTDLFSETTCNFDVLPDM